jgi:hypothetical protein
MIRRCVLCYSSVGFHGLKRAGGGPISSASYCGVVTWICKILLLWKPPLALEIVGAYSAMPSTCTLNTVVQPFLP